MKWGGFWGGPSIQKAQGQAGSLREGLRLSGEVGAGECAGSIGAAATQFQATVTIQEHNLAWPKGLIYKRNHTSLVFDKCCKFLQSINVGNHFKTCFTIL